MPLKSKPKNIPQKPGVYFFMNPRGKILYVGKANILKNRLGHYFQKNGQAPKVEQLLKEASKVSWEVANSEVEALIKEAEHIKKYRPKYNILMRDDKQYLYVGFTREKFPKIFVTHQPHPSGEVFIGPFTESWVLRQVLRSLRRAFPYCTCLHPHKGLCLNARMGRCMGYCCNKTMDYKLPAINHSKNISAIKKILSGKNKTLLRELKKEMKRLSKAQKYEEAGKARDQIKILERIFAHSAVLKGEKGAEYQKALNYLEGLLKIEEVKRIEAYDIANIQGKFAYGSMAVFTNGERDISQYRIFKIKTVKGSNDPAMIKEVLERRLRHNEWKYPDVIIVDGGKAQLGAVLNAIRYKLNAKVIALTKDKRHRGDHIYVAGRPLPTQLSALPNSLKHLILHLDSEAHRFAIKHYRKAHRKNIVFM